MKCNGTYVVQVHTRHGHFAFRNQRFVCRDRGSFAFLHTAHENASAVTSGLQSAVTSGLQTLAVQMCLHTASYEKARRVLAEVTGASLVTRQTLCNWVATAASVLDRHLAHEVAQAQQTPLPAVADTVDVYDPQVAELIVFEDGILVKAQKPTREQRTQGSAQQRTQGSAQQHAQPGGDKPCQFHQASFALAPYPDGEYAFVLGSGDGTVSLPEALRAFVCQQWPHTPQPLPVVAITDGAKDLRKDLDATFGKRVTLILDWYHLRKKVCELCSMLVATKEGRAALKKQMLRALFHGRVSEALQILVALPVRNAAMHQKLATYLNNHAHEIIDYARRREAGKCIGSGRMEKGVDQVVGLRQKDKGMSWSKSGSYALAMVSAYQANGQGDHLWRTVPLAA